MFEKYVSYFGYTKIKRSYKPVAGGGGGSGGAMVLGKLPVPERPTILITVGQGPIALAVGRAGMVWTFLLSSIPFLSYFSLSLGDGPI